MRSKLLLLLVILSWASAARPVWAQPLVAPYLGLNWGGDSICLTAQSCEDTLLNLGTSVGAMRLLPGIGSRDVFGKTPDGSRVFVLNGSGLVARMTPHISALFAPQGSLKFWRGTFRVVVSF